MAHRPLAPRSRSFSTLLAIIASLAIAGCKDTSAPAASARVPAALQLVSGDDQSDTVGQRLPQAIVVRAVDFDNRPVAGFPVSFQVISGGGALDSGTAITDAQGLAQKHWTLGTSVADTQAVRASVLDDAGRDDFIGVDFTAIPLPDVPATLTVLEGGEQISIAGTTRSDSIVVRVTDRFDNLLPGVAVGWWIPELAGSITAITGVTSTTGTASARWTPGTRSGSFTGTVSAGDGASLEFTSVVEAAAPALLVVESGAAEPVITGTTVPVVVRLTDSYGNPVKGAPVDFAAEGSGTSANPARDFTDAQGRARTTWSTGATEGTIALRASFLAIETSIRAQAIIDAPPVLTIADPYEQYVACPTVELAVTCTDNDPAGCRSITVTVSGRTLLTGTSSATGTVSLEDYEGRLVTLVFTATDLRGQTTRTERHVFVESNMRLQKLPSADGQLLDYRGGRLLHLHAKPSGMVMAIREGIADVEIPLAASTSLSTGIATPTGALVVGHQDGWIFPTLYEWRNGALNASLGVNSASSLVANGNFAIFGVGGTSYSGVRLVRRDLVTGTDVEIASAAGDVSNGVAENGDVAFWKMDYDIYRYHDGVTTRLTADDDASFLNTYPLTDGTNVIFQRHSLATDVAQPRYQIVLHDGVNETVLAGPRAQEPYPNLDFAVNGGWTAFTLPDVGGVLQLWTRSPVGDLHQATHFGVPSRIAALGSDGAVVVTTGNQRYLIEAGGTPENVSSALGRVIWRDGEFLVLLGRMPFRITR